MLNTLVHKIDIHKGLQSVLFVATVAYTHSISFDDLHMNQFVVKFI